MDYIIIILLIIILIIGVISLFKNINESNITERLGKLEVSMMKEMGDFKSELSRNMNKDFQDLNEQLERRLLAINEKVNTRLDENFEKTNKTFMNVIERLSKIDEAQKKIETLSTDIVSLQSILTDKKTRGIFGEVNLKHILTSVFGEKNDNIFKLQYTLSTGVIADSVVFAPEPLGTIAIDSKFPLEHYQLMVDKKLSQDMRDNYEKMFKQDMKKHIDAISSKYIIPGETAEQAILFLPAEAIFAEVNAYHQDIINYAYKKRVWITSPTTLISTLTVVEMIIKNMERDKYTSIIHEELNKLGLEFSRYKERWDKLAKSIQTVNKDVENVTITTDKITKKFEAINKVEVEVVKQIDHKE
ncbi:MAG: DNA recombination protein RmuC [Mycoplasmatota bacterium]|nr:DNA recombination protein RmuC [Mycoplasmatota bacterium]